MTRTFNKNLQIVVICKQAPISVHALHAYVYLGQLSQMSILHQS